MKLAKKALAVIMALGLIACMAAMAFATDVGSYSVYYAKSEDGKTLTATVYAHSYFGLCSGSVNVKYSGGEKYDHYTAGVQAKKVANDADGFSWDNNGTVAGEVIYGFYFTEQLWDRDTYANEMNATINVQDFDLVTFTFLLDGSAYEIDVTVTSKSVDGNNSVFYDTNTGAAQPANTTTPIKDTIPVPAANPCDPNPDPKAPCNPDPAPCAPEKTAPAKPVKTDGGKDTGDNSVIALTAGVIALGAVAFVVTKKRK